MKARHPKTKAALAQPAPRPRKLNATADGNAPAGTRLQKYLAHAGVCSRRQGEALITAGRVAVNGQVVTALGTRIDPAVDRVAVDAKPVAGPEDHVYLMLHKPPGYVTSCEQNDEKIVLDLVDVPRRVYPVGRLDKDSSGLLILTNDGRIHHRLSHPSFDHEKEYVVTLDRDLPTGALRRMAEGLPMMGTRTRPARVTRVGPARLKIVLKEGRNRQIRRMVRKVGGAVTALKRVRMGNLRLGRLAVGKWRPLTTAERDALLRLLDLPIRTDADR